MQLCKRWLFCFLITGGLFISGWAGAEGSDTEKKSSKAETAEKLEAEQNGWPFLRGPGFDGHSSETGLADSWPSDGPPVLWTLPLGQGYSGFVAWEERIATQYQTLGGQYAVCMDANTGKTLWQYRYAGTYQLAGVYPGPRATPTYAQGNIYFASPGAVIGCLDARNGKLRWSVDLLKQFGGERFGFGYSCSPVVVEGKVILPVGAAGASMVALDAKDGSVVWQKGDDMASYTPAYPITFRGRSLVIGYLQNALVCRDLDSGELVWRYELSAGYDEHSAWPIFSEPYLWISKPFQGGAELLELTGDEEHPLKTVSLNENMSNDIFSSVLIDGAVYGFDLHEPQSKVHRPSRGQFRCVDFLSGEVYWSTGDAKRRRAKVDPTEDIGKRIGHATVIAADAKLIFLNDTGELILARATKERYEELGRVSVLGGEICWTQPALFQGRLFVRNQSRAACIYLGDVDSLAPQVKAELLTASDIPQAEYFDWAGAILGIEPEYAFDIPSIEWLRDWFLISLLGIMGGSLLGVGAMRWLLGERLGSGATRWIYWSSVFFFGALGTTFVSGWLGSFVFTWQVSIFAAFQVAVWEIDVTTKGERLKSRWLGRFVFLGFLLICLAYFLICRRLSLVFEWVFLCGFGAALPFSAAGKFFLQGRRMSWLWEIVTTGAAFAAFYWSSAAMLWFK